MFDGFGEKHPDCNPDCTKDRLWGVHPVKIFRPMLFTHPIYTCISVSHDSKLLQTVTCPVHGRTAEELVGLPMLLQPLPPFHHDLLSHNIHSLLAMLPLRLQAFLRAFTLPRRPRRLAHKVMFFRFP